MQRFLWSQLGHVIPRKFIVLFGQGRYCEGITHYLLVFSRSEDLFIYFSSTKERLPHFISVASRNKFLSGYFWIRRFVSALRRNLTIIFQPYIQKFPIKDPNIISTTSSPSLLIIKWWFSPGTFHQLLIGFFNTLHISWWTLHLITSLNIFRNISHIFCVSLPYQMWISNFFFFFNLEVCNVSQLNGMLIFKYHWTFPWVLLCKKTILSSAH